MPEPVILAVLTGLLGYGLHVWLGGKPLEERGVRCERVLDRLRAMALRWED